MTTKKKQQAAPAPRELTKAERFYIDGNRDALGDKRIAEDLGLPQALVRETIKAMEVEDVKKGVKRPPRIGQFQVGGDKHAVSVAMTPAQAMADDDARNQPNPAFLDKYKNCIHKIERD